MSDKHKYQITRRIALKAIIAGTSVAIGFKAFALSNENEKQGKKGMNIVVIVSFEAKEDKITDFIKILEGVKTELPKVKGCIGVNIFQSSSITNMFTLVETWETKELHQASLDNLSKNGTWDTIASHLATDPKSDYFTQL